MDASNQQTKIFFTPPEHPYPQQFSIMYPIIKSIYTNPSSGKAWKKLIKTCKYFYTKNPIFPIRILESSGETKWIADGESCDTSTFDSHESNRINAKLWLFDQYGIGHSHFDFDTIYSLMPKIYKISLQKLWFCNQNIPWEDYEILTLSGSIKYLSLIRTTVKYSDETIVTVDKLLQNLNNLITLDMACPGNPLFFEADTVTKMVEILTRFKNLRSLQFRELPESFEFSNFTTFLMNNETVKIQIYYFIDLSEVYNEILINFIDKIVANPPKTIPYIEFPGFTGEKYTEYRKLYDSQNKFVFKLPCSRR